MMTKTFTSHTPRQAPSARAGGTARPDSPKVASKPGRRSVAREDLDSAAARKARERGEDRSRKKEIGGPEGPEPTRFGDWERKGICYDF